MKVFGLHLSRYGIALVILMVIQALCSLFFVIDVLADVMEFGPGSDSAVHIGFEIAANFGLVAAIVFEARYLRRVLRRQAYADRALSAASGALAEVIEAYFDEWKLTPSEADVANFTIKGYSIAEVSTLRKCAEGTVKTHLNSIYRKAGVAGRAQLVSLLIEDLLRGRIAENPDTPASLGPRAEVGT